MRWPEKHKPIIRVRSKHMYIHASLSGAPNGNIVQNHLNIELLNVFGI